MIIGSQSPLSGGLQNTGSYSSPSDSPFLPSHLSSSRKLSGVIVLREASEELKDEASPASLLLQRAEELWDEINEKAIGLASDVPLGSARL